MAFLSRVHALTLCALLTLLGTFGGDANAYPSDGAGACWRPSGGVPATCFPTATAAAQNYGEYSQGPPVEIRACASGATIGSPVIYYCYDFRKTSPLGSWAEVWVRNYGTVSCASGGTLSGMACVCSGGMTDTGTSCAAACPSAGSDLGYQSVTTGWALSGVPGADDIVTDNMGTIYGGTHCVPEGAGNCGATLSTTDPPGACWRASAPTDQGLYRLSCDIKMKSSGSSCTPAAGAPTTPDNTSPTCPTGSVGTVNGKAVCLGTMPAHGIDFGANELPGNPRAGTSPTSDNNTAREPNSGSGGGPDGRGGPGVTRGADGTVGTGSDRTAGSGSGAGSSPGDGIELPTDYNREATQQNIYSRLHDLKMNEAGTPTGEGADTEAIEGVNTEAGKIESGLEGILAGDGAPDRSWGFGITFPSTCNPFVLGNARWGFFELDFCQFQDVVHDLMSLVWVGMTVFLCIGMAARTAVGGA